MGRQKGLPHHGELRPENFGPMLVHVCLIEIEPADRVTVRVIGDGLCRMLGLRDPVQPATLLPEALCHGDNASLLRRMFLNQEGVAGHARVRSGRGRQVSLEVCMYPMTGNAGRRYLILTADMREKFHYEPGPPALLDFEVAAWLPLAEPQAPLPLAEQAASRATVPGC